MAIALAFHGIGIKSLTGGIFVVLLASDTTDVMEAIVKPEADKDAYGNGELLERNQAATHGWSRDLRLVHRNNMAEHTDGEATDSTPCEDPGVALSSSLKD